MTFLFVLAATTLAFARAGGGQGYGGGGDFGGGIWALWPLLFWGHGSGFGGLILLLIILYLYRQMQARSTMSGGMSSGVTESPGVTVAPAALAADERSIADGLSKIKARDPNFDERAFLDRAQTAFFKIQQAWTQRNQDVARDVMSDALYERHKMQTDQLIANHQIDVLENIVIGHARIVAVQPGETYDSITVAFTASMADYTVDEQSKRIVQGDRSRRTFTEYWTFIRRADARTVAGQTALQSTCPSCGAPLKLAGGRCEYCGAPVRTSSSDWVVDTIEQAN